MKNRLLDGMMRNSRENSLETQLSILEDGDIPAWETETENSDSLQHGFVKYRRRIRGQPTRIERQIFYKGQCYVVTEAYYSESDKSSIYTSEDDFKEDTEVACDFADNFPLKDQ